MRRGPQPGAPGTVDHVAKARGAWGPEIPGWVLLLAEAVQREGLRRVAERIRYSTSTISTVLSGTYGAANLDRIREAVLGALGGADVACPALGRSIDRADCIAHQRARLSTASPQSVRLYHACPTCRVGAGKQTEAS